jgi:hypothetical protein
MCPTCKSSLPTIASLDPLPHIQQLGSPSDTVKNALIEEFYAAKERNQEGGSKKEKDALEEASTVATKAVD